MSTLTEEDVKRARRLIWTLLRLEPHETDDRMVSALAVELAGIRDDARSAPGPANYSEAVLGSLESLKEVATIEGSGVFTPKCTVCGKECPKTYGLVRNLAQRCADCLWVSYLKAAASWRRDTDRIADAVGDENDATVDHILEKIHELQLERLQLADISVAAQELYDHPGDASCLEDLGRTLAIFNAREGKRAASLVRRLVIEQCIEELLSKDATNAAYRLRRYALQNESVESLPLKVGDYVLVNFAGEAWEPATVVETKTVMIGAASGNPEPLLEARVRSLSGWTTCPQHELRRLLPVYG